MSPSGPATEEKAEQPRPGGVRLMGVPIRLHFTFVILLIFIATLGIRGGESAIFNAIYISALFASVLLHELGHAGVAKRYGIRTLEITMYPIGGLARLERSPKPREELWIALAGPAVNVLIATALFAYLGYMRAEINPNMMATPSDTNLLARIGLGNLVLAAFNMIPAYPMDGGRVLRALLARWQPEERATRMAAAAGRALAILIGLYGLLSMQFMLVFIAFFVYLGASQETAAVVGRSLTEGVPVQSAMITDFRTLEHGSTIREAANLLIATSQTDFPVVLGQSVMGLLGRNALLRGMAVDGPDAYVAGIMDRNFPRVAPGTSLEEAIPFLGQTSCLLVMDEDRLLGLLTRENLSEYMMLRRFGMAPEARA
jgi:Zn-dependent protease/CBS domain-containing protein